MQAFGLGIVLMLSAPAAVAHSTSPDPSGVIAGRVIIDGQPAAGVMVWAARDSLELDKTATTAEDGRFRLSRLAAGLYQVSAFTPAFFVKGIKSYGQDINLGEGETVEGIDFTMERGGAITGRVTDAAGSPIVEEAISVGRITGPKGDSITLWRYDFVTDDRGIYRVYGLPPGRYIVGIGCGDEPVRATGRCYPRTYHPGVTEQTRATVLELGSGGEVNGADIKVGEHSRSFRVSGRVVDDSGKAVPGVRLNYGTVDEDGDPVVRHGTSREWLSGADGTFRLDNLAAGQYWLCTLRGSGGSLYSDVVRFEVTDGDVSDLNISVHSGASVSGVVVMEGQATAEAQARFSRLGVYAQEQDEVLGDPSFDPVWVGPGGSFTISGIKPGNVRIRLSGGAALFFRLKRVDRDGMAQPEGFALTSGETLTGIRLVVEYQTGVLSGQVQVPAGMTRPLTRFVIYAVSHDAGVERYAALDSRDHFVIEGLSEGQYEVTLLCSGADGRLIPQPKQVVTVTREAATVMTLILSLPQNR